MDRSTCLVITSIQNSEHAVLRNYANTCVEKGISFIVAGDIQVQTGFDLPGCEYLSLEKQHALPFKLPKLLPDKNYAKKNVAYLQAIQQGHEVIIETDDDNLPLETFWEMRNEEIKADLADNSDWVNVYTYFSDKNIWPRGFSLKHLKANSPLLKTNNKEAFFSPIQQGLADENPDVDAIYRLSSELPVYFQKRIPVALETGTICPSNSQNTTWFREAFPLLYLPSFCSFRMCDIWRSFVAQRILWANEWHLSFHNATVVQKRNEHDLMKDLEDEISGYLNNHTIMEELRQLSLKPGELHIYENLRLCYQLLTEKNYIDKKELVLLEAWISDLQSL